VRWDSEQIAIADAAKRRGDSWAQIGAVFGVSGEAVRTAVRDRRLGATAPASLPTSNVNPPPVNRKPEGKPLPPFNCRVRRAFSTERILILPDTHRPFHSKMAWAVAMAAGRGFRPDRIIHLGDLWDFYAISFHPKSPDRRSNLEAEIKDGCEALDEMADLGAKRLDITLGNHEFRWDRYLTQNAPDMYNFLRFEEVVRFKERGWHVTPYRQHLTVGKMHFTHEVGYCGKQAHTQSRQEFEGNCVIGHTHGLASEYKGNLLNSAHVGIQLGWLGDKEAIDYAHQRRSASWVHAFGIAYHEPNGAVHVFPTPIVNGHAVVEGHVYDAPESARAAA
jgi:hypothetical protein